MNPYPDTASTPSQTTNSTMERNGEGANQRETTPSMGELPKQAQYSQPSSNAPSQPSALYNSYRSRGEGSTSQPSAPSVNTASTNTASVNTASMNPNGAKEPITAPYVPTVRSALSPNQQQYYVLPTDEIQKMLQQNAVIIKRLITTVSKGKGYDMAEYSGLHTSVYLLSLFAKSKNGNASKVSIPVSVYQNLIKRLKGIGIYASNQEQPHRK